MPTLAKADTRKTIADILKISQPKVNEKISIFIKKVNADISDKSLNFTPFLYNLWNSSKDNSITHFGNMPEVFVENLSKGEKGLSTLTNLNTRGLMLEKNNFVF